MIFVTIELNGMPFAAREWEAVPSEGDELELLVEGETVWANVTRVVWLSQKIGSKETRVKILCIREE